MHERELVVPEAADRTNLAAFVGRALRLDEAVVIRLRQRAAGRVALWCTTAGFGALAVRVIGGTVRPADTCVAADELSRNLEAAQGEQIEPGFAMDSAWRGALPPDDGFVHVEDVPARDLVDLAQQGAVLAREHSTMTGPPRSLLDQTVVDADGGGRQVAVPLRCVFALTSMGFIPAVTQNPSTGEVDASGLDRAEPVRVRTDGTWLRLDGRFGSVFHRIGGDLPLSVL